MANSLKKRWHLLRQAVWDRPVPRWLAITIALFSAWDLLVSQFLPPEIAETMPRVYDFVSITSEFLPWWGWLLILMATITISTIEYLHRHIKKVDAELSTNSIDLELTPSSGPSPDIRLSIKNLGVAAKFSATCRTIAARNDVNKLRTGVFNLRWKSTGEKWIEISKNESQELFIARWQMWEDHKLCQIDILEWSNSGPQEFTGARWNLSSEKNLLPEFDVEISIFQESADEPRVAKYTLRPANQFGPLELIPLLVQNNSASKYEDQEEGPVYWTLAQTLSWIGFGKPITRQQWTKDYIADDLLIRPEDEIRRFNEAEQQFFEKLRGEELTALGKKNDSQLYEKIPATYFLSDVECAILHDQISGGTSSLNTMLKWRGPKWEDVRIKRKDVLSLWPSPDGDTDSTQ